MLTVQAAKSLHLVGVGVVPQAPKAERRRPVASVFRPVFPLVCLQALNVIDEALLQLRKERVVLGFRVAVPLLLLLLLLVRPWRR